MVAVVNGTPTFRYSTKPIVTLGRAPSTTIILAIDPRMVRFPARVLLMARRSHAVSGSGIDAMTGLRRSTAGTLLTRFERRALALTRKMGCPAVFEPKEL